MPIYDGNAKTAGDMNDGETRYFEESSFLALQRDGEPLRGKIGLVENALGLSSRQGNYNIRVTRLSGNFTTYLPDAVLDQLIRTGSNVRSLYVQTRVVTT